MPKQIREKFLTELSEDENLMGIGTYPCVFKLGNSFYDYTKFKIAQDAWAATDISTSTGLGQVFNFGWCQVLQDTSVKNCTGDMYAGSYPYGNSTWVDGTQCQTAYSGADPSDIVTTEITKDLLIVNSATYTNLTGVALTYKGGATCATNPTATNTFTINIYCDKNVQGDYDSKASMTDPCNPSVNLVSEYGCSVLDTSTLWEYLDQYSAYFGAVLIVAGVLLNFLGRKLIRPSVCFAGFLTSVFVACFLYYTVFLSGEPDMTTFWIFFGVGIVGGIIVGLLLGYFVKVGAAILAGWGGFCGGLMLNESVFAWTQQNWLFWVICIGCAIAAAIMAFISYNIVTILSTVFLGAYAVIIGVNCYAGGYINPFTMADHIKNGLPIPMVYWAYVAGFCVLALVGFIVQWKSFKAESKEQ